MDERIPYLIGIIVENSNETKENNKIPGQHGDVECFATLNFGDYVDLSNPVYGGIKKAVLDYISENSLQTPEGIFSLTDSEKDDLKNSREVAYNGGTPTEETGEYSSEKVFYSTVNELADDMSKFAKLLRKPDMEPSDTMSGTFGSVLDISAEKNTDLYSVKIGDVVNVVWTDENGTDTAPIPMIVVMRKKFIDGVPEGEEPEEPEFDGTGIEDEFWDQSDMGTNAGPGEEDITTDSADEEEPETETNQGQESEEPESEELEQDADNGDETKKYDVFGNEIK